VSKRGKQAIIDEAAYTWFNRLCALRYMDVNHYTPVGIVSPTTGFTQPEVLQQAKQGLFEKDWQFDRKRVGGLLSRSISSPDGDQEAYRLLLVAACNSYNREMDFLFTAIEDVTELLMPEDLLSSQSVLQAVRDTLTPEVCQDVEVIGWLYQFYISEKKDQVMAKKGAVASQDIPAVTQLFTPDWIVRYMVQNSLGRLWLLNHPDSDLRSKMEYYVQPTDPETDFLKVSSPEDLKVLDPACGSGHILTYAFDLLYAIYEEQGYDPVRIPQYILQKNLFGIEIDKRAAMLSSFALMMKARAKDKRFFNRGIQPNILEMENVSFEPAEIKAYLDRLGRDLYTQDLWEGLQQFENAKTYGSLIRPAVKDVPALRERMRETRIFDDLLLSSTNTKLLKVLEMSEYLSPRYQVVVANPPYLSRKGMASDLAQFMNEKYSDNKTDLFAAFIVRCSELVVNLGNLGMMSPNVWMYLSSHEKLREFLTNAQVLTSLVELPLTGFKGATVQICTFAYSKRTNPEAIGSYIRLVDFKGGDEEMAEQTRTAIANPDCGWFFRASAQDFKKIPGTPIAYWVKNLKNFTYGKMSNFFISGGRNKTHDNERYVRFVWEVSKENCKWKGYCNGGEFRKWFGNDYYYVDWSPEARKFYESLGGLVNPMFNDAEGITWSLITSGKNSFRKKISKNIYSSGSPTIIKPDYKFDGFTLGLLNSKVSIYYLQAINPTLNTTVNDVLNLPFPNYKDSQVINNTETLINIAESSWNKFETSTYFMYSPLIQAGNIEQVKSLRETYSDLLLIQCKSIETTRRLEEENNRVFIEAYGLQDELSPEVPLEEITLTCNPHYRYKGNLTVEEREARLLRDTMKEFLSYAVGCMFGRYSLDKPGLILANQGETLRDYIEIIGKKPTFSPSESNVIPILDGDWFPDDITARFRQFLKITFGEPNFEENLRFIEDALGKDLRAYFLKDFYKDHLQTYKKRPIYWLFSSPKGSFNALIYMHRYQPETVSVILNQYLREYREKLNAQRRYQESLSISPSSSPREKTTALKEIENLSKILAELKTYEDEVLFPLAGKQIEIDLDDGVVVNYAKFGDALRKI
jgi:type II restriction/modification system DNA methylase subunit YeeA